MPSHHGPGGGPSEHVGLVVGCFASCGSSSSSTSFSSGIRRKHTTSLHHRLPRSQPWPRPRCRQPASFPWERTSKLQELLALEAELKQTQAALEQYADNDPSRIEAMSADGPALGSRPGQEPNPDIGPALWADHDA